MRRNRLIITAASAVLAAAALSPAGPRGAARAQQASSAAADRAIDRAVSAWAGVKTLRGTVEQTVTNPLTGKAMTARGEVQQRRPGRFAVRFTEPAGDVIVADGTTLWIYLPSTAPNQVIKAPLAEAAGMSIDLSDQFLSSPRTKYDITDAGTETIGGRVTRALRLIPKAGQKLGFVRAKVWIDEKDGLIRQFEVADQSGLSRRVTLSNVKVNAKVSTSAFKFTPPAGARVVTR